GGSGGVEAEVVVLAAPEAAGGAEQILDREAVTEAEVGAGNLDGTVLDGEGIEVDADDEHVGKVAAEAGVEEHLGVVGAEEAQAFDALQGGMLAADLVDAGDGVFDVSRAVPVPDLELVFF